MSLPKRIGIISYLLSVFAGFVSWILFWVLNRTTVIGSKNISHRQNYLIVSNHRTLIDSLLVATAFCFPEIVILPRLAPYHTPDAQNYLKAKLLAGNSKFLAKIMTPFTTFLFIHLKCVPVGNNRKDVKALMSVTSALKKGNSVHVFPEGTRSRTNELGKPRDGIGLVIHDVQPQILPVFVDGIEKVLPISAKFPRIGKRITVTFGKPFNCEEFSQLPRNRKTWQAIAQHIMGKIAELAPKT